MCGGEKWNETERGEEEKEEKSGKVKGRGKGQVEVTHWESCRYGVSYLAVGIVGFISVYFTCLGRATLYRVYGLDAVTIRVAWRGQRKISRFEIKACKAFNEICRLHRRIAVHKEIV